MLIPARLNGPPDSANGGIAAGRLAAFLATDGPVTVTLRCRRRSTRAMIVQSAEGGVSLLSDDKLVAEAGPPT